MDGGPVGKSFSGILKAGDFRILDAEDEPLTAWGHRAEFDDVAIGGSQIKITAKVKRDGHAASIDHRKHGVIFRYPSSARPLVGPGDEITFIPLKVSA